MDDNSGGCFIWVILIVAGIVYWATGPWRNEAISYSGHCYNGKVVAPFVYAKDMMGTLDLTTAELKDEIRACRVGVGARTVYSLFPSAGKVVYRTGDLPLISELNDCRILDADNWSCRYSDGSGGVGFLDGFPSVFETSAGDTFYLRRWQYHLLRWIGPMEGGRWYSALLIPDQQGQAFWR